MTVTKISKTIRLKLFPGYEVQHKFYGSSGPGKDVLVRFDFISKMLKDKVRFESEGLRWKNHFRPWIEIPSLFSCTEDFFQITEEITS